MAFSLTRFPLSVWLVHLTDLFCAMCMQGWCFYSQAFMLPTVTNTHTNRCKHFSPSFSAFSLQLGPVPSGFLKYNTITIYHNLSLILPPSPSLCGCCLSASVSPQLSSSVFKSRWSGENKKHICGVGLSNELIYPHTQEACSLPSYDDDVIQKKQKVVNSCPACGCLMHYFLSWWEIWGKRVWKKIYTLVVYAWNKKINRKNPVMIKDWATSCTWQWSRPSWLTWHHSGIDFVLERNGSLKLTGLVFNQRHSEFISAA